MFLYFSVKFPRLLKTKTIRAFEGEAFKSSKGSFKSFWKDIFELLSKIPGKKQALWDNPSFWRKHYEHCKRNFSNVLKKKFSLLLRRGEGDFKVSEERHAQLLMKSFQIICEKNFQVICERLPKFLRWNESSEERIPKHFRRRFPNCSRETFKLHRKSN